MTLANINMKHSCKLNSSFSLISRMRRKRPWPFWVWVAVATVSVSASASVALDLEFDAVDEELDDRIFYARHGCRQLCLEVPTQNWFRMVFDVEFFLGRWRRSDANCGMCRLLHQLLSRKALNVSNVRLEHRHGLLIAQ